MASRFLMVDGARKWTPALVAYEARKLAIQVAKIGFEAKAQASVNGQGGMSGSRIWMLQSCKTQHPQHHRHSSIKEGRQK